MRNSNTLGHLMRLCSSTLPVGAYSYSQGLETALDEKWLCNENEVLNWLTGVAYYSFSIADLAVMRKVYKARIDGDFSKVKHWNGRLLAMRETKELRAEDITMGRALAKLLTEEMVVSSSELAQLGDLSYSIGFSLACNYYQIQEDEMISGYCWSWAENLIAAAIKLMPLGQTKGQWLMREFISRLDEYVERSKIENDLDIGSGLPGLIVSSCRHEHQYSRLFRS